MSLQSSVQVAVVGPTVWIRVVGRGSFQNSTGLKELAAKMMAQGHREFIIDLKECELMDSTFMGTLAGIALRLGENGNVKVLRANPRNHQVLSNLGLDRLLTLESDSEQAVPVLKMQDTLAPSSPRDTQRDTIIQAHENLVTANPENAIRFKDVLDFLKSKDPEEESASR